jgi:DNA polymerase I-like protein with 3'-5' exonuclease and polymerase domains
MLDFLKEITFNPPLCVERISNLKELESLILFFDNKLDKSDLCLGFDLETTPVKDFYTRRCRTIQFGDYTKQFVIDLLAFCDNDPELLEKSQGEYGKNLCPNLRELFEKLSPYTCNGKFILTGVNLAFEYMILYWNFGQRTWNFFSCDIAERLIVAGAHSLKDYDYFSMSEMIARYFKAKVHKELQTSFNLTDPLTNEQIEYAAIDTRLPLVLREAQLKILKKDGLEEITKIENDAIGSFVDMHVHGLRVDTDKWNGIEEKKRTEFEDVITHGLDPIFVPIVGSKSDVITQERIDAANAKWKAIKDTKAADRIKLKKQASDISKTRTKQKNLSKKCEGDALINYASGAQVLKVFKTMPELAGLKNTNDDNLAKYDSVPVIQHFRLYRELSKQIKTYGKTWTTKWTTHPCKEEGWLHPGDGKLHSNFNQLDASTGRSTSSGPNDQNIPTDPDIRACFVCDPPDAEEPDGYCIVTADMSGAELRILAELSGEPVWIKAFNFGEDVHEVCAEMMYEKEWLGWALADCKFYQLKPDGNPTHKKCKCPEHKDRRDEAKVPNFLIPYGGGAPNLAAQLPCSVERAGKILAKHEAAFPILWDYLRNSGEQAKLHRAAWSMFGRRKIFLEPNWENAYNAILEDMKEEDSRWEKYMRKDPSYFGFKAKKWNDDMWEEAIEKKIEQHTIATGKKPLKDDLFKLMHREKPESWMVSSMIRSMFSRIERQGKNHPIQATNADIIKLAMGCGFDKDGKPFLWHRLPEFKAKVLAMVHDELLIQCPRRFGKAVADLIGDAFKRAAAEKMSKVVMEFDYHIENCWTK